MLSQRTNAIGVGFTCVAVILFFSAGCARYCVAQRSMQLNPYPDRQVLPCVLGCQPERFLFSFGYTQVQPLPALLVIRFLRPPSLSHRLDCTHKKRRPQVESPSNTNACEPCRCAPRSCGCCGPSSGAVGSDSTQPTNQSPGVAAWSYTLVRQVRGPVRSRQSPGRSRRGPRARGSCVRCVHR